MYHFTSQKSSLFVKLVECCLVAFAIINCYNTLIVYLFSSRFEKAVHALNYLRLFGMLLVIASALFAFIYPVFWHLKEKSAKINSVAVHVIFIVLIRTWLSVMICSYAFAKIIGTQFPADLIRNDSLARDLSGYA